MILSLGVALLGAVCAIWCLVVFTKRDATAFITLFVILLFAIPANQVFLPLGAIGQPSLLLGLLAGWWWVLARLGRVGGIDTQLRLSRVYLVGLMIVFICSAALAFTRPLTGLEVTSSTRAVVRLLSLIGVALLVADGVRDRARLDVLLRRVVFAAACMSALAMVQFFAGFDPVGSLNLPLLSPNGVTAGLGTRAAFNRPAGTALHPIELGVVLAGVLPLALHYAFNRSVGMRTWRVWVPVPLIGAAMLTSLSRSGIVSVVIGLLVLALGWSWQRRAAVALGGLGFITVMWATIPGLIGTLISLFVNAGDDPSIQARAERVPRFLELWAQHRWVGRGFGTYSVEDYFLLDNQVYVTLIESGVVGALTWLLGIGGICVTAIWVTRRTDEPVARQLAMALTGCAFALLISFATFDAFYYRILTGLLFLTLGAAGALVRLVQDAPVVFHGGATRASGREDRYELRKI